MSSPCHPLQDTRLTSPAQDVHPSNSISDYYIVLRVGRTQLGNTLVGVLHDPLLVVDAIDARVVRDDARPRVELRGLLLDVGEHIGSVKLALLAEAEEADNKRAREDLGRVSAESRALLDWRNVPQQA